MDISHGVSTEILNNGESIEVSYGEHKVLLIKQEGRFYAIQAYIPHLGERLSEGRLVGYYLKTLKSHIRFDIRTGEPVASILVRKLNCWVCEVRDDKVFISHPLILKKHESTMQFADPVVIIGAGAAGVSTALSLRQGGYRGPLIMISEGGFSAEAEESASAVSDLNPEPSSLLLFNKEYYKEKNIELIVGQKIEHLDGLAKTLKVGDKEIRFSYCVMATGSRVIKPPISGADKSHVHYIKGLRDLEFLIEKVQRAHQAVVVGSGLLALEVAATLKSAGVHVVVVSEEGEPATRLFGAPIGKNLRELHEANGVHFSVGSKVQEIFDGYLSLNTEEIIKTDFVIMALGTTPNVSLAQMAGCKVKNGIIVDRSMRTSVPGIFAAGEVAKFPSRFNNETQRFEQWEVAEHHGSVVAQNILGKRVHYNEVPFFSTEQFGKKMAFIGYSKSYDSFEIRGDLKSYKYSVAYYLHDEIVAILVSGNEKLSLMVEEALFEMDSRKAKKTIDSFFARYLQ